MLFRIWCTRVKFSGSEAEFLATSFDLLVDAIEGLAKWGNGVVGLGKRFENVSKLGANDRTHAVTIAVRRGFLQI